MNYYTATWTWLLALGALGASSTDASTCIPDKDHVTFQSAFSTIDTRFPADDVHTFTIQNGYTVTVTGFDSTRAIGYGFRCFDHCQLGEERNKARATASGLEPGGRYRYRLWQWREFEEPSSGKGSLDNSLYVNGGEEIVTTMGYDTAAYGYATATAEGTIEFLFEDTNLVPRMGFSWIVLARVCGCTTDRECPGGELCEGMSTEGEGVCTPGAAECADVDHRVDGPTCKSLAGSGTYAGNAWCSLKGANIRPLEMCCECSGGVSWVKTPYQIDNGGYEWRDFGGATSKGGAKAVVLEVGANHKVRGVMVDPAPGKKTPENISASGGGTSSGPWTQVATWEQDKWERVWTDLESDEPFLQLSWESVKASKVSNIRVKLGNNAVDSEEPQEGWTGSFSLVKGDISSKPRCIISNGCVSSPFSPEQYRPEKQCEIRVEEDTVLVATHFEVVSERGDVWDDYFMIDSKMRGSSGVYTGSAGPYHVPVLAGDRLIWSVDDWEEASGFRVCGYNLDGGELPKWTPIKKECSSLRKGRACREANCQWIKSKKVCRDKFKCENILKRGKCTRFLEKKGCEWFKKERVCKGNSFSLD